MENELENYLDRIEEFADLKPSNQIPFLAYYNIEILGKEGVTPSDIESTFNKAYLAPYSNISVYFSNKLRSRKSNYVKINGKYHLERSFKKEIEEDIGVAQPPKPSDNLFPLKLIENTRGYIEEVGKQASICYSLQQFDACSVMIRKLIEILIIECFERHNISQKIKDEGNNFYFLNSLISIFQEEESWNLGRETKSSLPKLKKIGDRSAHGRRWVAHKSDLDKLKDNIRVVIAELIHLIDFPSWNQELSEN